jgi:hypothetical protein
MMILTSLTNLIDTFGTQFAWIAKDKIEKI